MPTRNKPAPRRAAPKKRSLTPALVDRIRHEGETKKARIAAQAQEDIATVQRLKREIAESFYEMGLTLTRLNDKAVLAALEFKTFDALCRKHFGFTGEYAHGLITIVQRTPRSFAVDTGQQRTLALIDLADAAQSDKTPMQLARGRLSLPSGKKLDVASASAHEIARTARALRTARPTSGRGRHLAREDADRAASLETAIHAAGDTDARVVALAGTGRKPAHFRLEISSWDGMKALQRALARALARTR